MSDPSPEERARNTALFTAFIKTVQSFQLANDLDLTTLARSQVWGMKETVRQAMGVDIGSEEDTALTKFFIDHVFALMTYVSKGHVPCLQ